MDTIDDTQFFFYFLILKHKMLMLMHQKYLSFKVYFKAPNASYVPF